MDFEHKGKHVKLSSLSLQDLIMERTNKLMLNYVRTGKKIFLQMEVVREGNFFKAVLEKSFKC